MRDAIGQNYALVGQILSEKWHISFHCGSFVRLLHGKKTWKMSFDRDGIGKLSSDHFTSGGTEQGAVLAK
jgi:hypothetical protein